MNEIWGSWFYRRPTNPPNLKKALREWLGGSYSIENDAHKQPQWQQFSIKIVNLKIPWGLWFYRCIFRKRVGISRIITIKLLTPTLSLNSKGDSLSTSWASFARSVMQLEPAKKSVNWRFIYMYHRLFWSYFDLINFPNTTKAPGSQFARRPGVWSRKHHERICESTMRIQWNILYITLLNTALKSFFWWQAVAIESEVQSPARAIGCALACASRGSLWGRELAASLSYWTQCQCLLDE